MGPIEGSWVMGTLRFCSSASLLLASWLLSVSSNHAAHALVLKYCCTLYKTTWAVYTQPSFIAELPNLWHSLTSLILSCFIYKMGIIIKKVKISTLQHF